jgi:5-formyltetrahydrofolate cyclo-ligase
VPGRPAPHHPQALRAEGGGAKQAVRERVWSRLEEAGAARFPGARGRIPNVAGAREAAERLAEVPEWAAATAIKANPDAPQLPVRARALHDGLLVVMAVPRLADARPFLLLDPATLDVAPRAAASIGGSARHGRPIRLDEVPPLDVVVVGSVAVDRAGRRVGKGGGYADLELGLCADAGLVGPGTMIVTTVHELQVLDEDLPQAAHDVVVDVIVTADRVLRTPGRRRAPTVRWDDLDAGMAVEIPALAALRPSSP